MSRAFTCREVASLLTEYREHAIPLVRRIRTRMHLRACPACRRLLSELEALPTVLRRLPPTDYPEIGAAALANAMQRLAEPRPSRRLPGTPVPGPVQRLLEGPADRPLRLLAAAHAALMRGPVPRSEPFLPDEILAQCAPPGAWIWRRSSDGVRRALLCQDPGGARLSLVFMPPGFASAPHLHRGSESILVLEGVLEDADRCLTNGDWIHFERGSSHAPSALLDGCWCLIRDEGTIHYAGPFGWLKDWLTS